MIQPSGIPQFTGDFDQLDKDVSALQSDAIGIRNGGEDVHSRFQMLGAFYKAPEADQLFATTRPVMDGSDTFATKLEKVAGALDTYSAEARPLAAKLKQLKADAIAFVDSVEGDDDWTEDEDKVHRHQALMDGVSTTQHAFQEAERRAATTISALVGGPKFITDDGHHTVNKKTVMYGYDLKTLEHAKELPWGVQEERTYEPWSAAWFGHGAKSFFWDGIVKDNIVGGLDGLWTLVGGHGGDRAGDAWGGLGDVLGGIGQYVASPYDWVMDKTIGPGPADPTSDRQKKAAKEFFKSLVAWDKWDENPARAAGTVVFNVATLGAGPLAVASKTAEAGAVAKTAGIAAKVGEFIDPVNVGLKATGQAVSKLPKLSDLTSRLLPATKAGTVDAQGVHSVIELSDGSKVLVKDGQFIAYDKNGKLVPDESKTEQPRTGSAPEPDSVRQPAMAGAASRTPNATAHAGDDLASGAGRDATAGHSSAHNSTPSSGDAAGSADGRHGAGSDVPPPRSGSGAAGHGGGTDGVGRGGHDGPDAGDQSASHRAGMSDEEILKRQLDRANSDPEWVKKHYYPSGRRRSIEGEDEFGDRLSQMYRTGDPNRPWTANLDTVRAVHHPGAHVGDPATVAPEHRPTLDSDAVRRRHAIDADLVAEKKKQAAQAHYDAHKTPENEAALHDAVAEYKETHTEVRDSAEELGEDSARYHAVPDHFPGSTRLDDGSRGRFKFDQIWRTPSGRYVVVEAKASTTTELGKRILGDGREYQQGTREYFEATLLKMEERGETDLADQLAEALEKGNLDYVEVRANPVGDQYRGYVLKYFNIGKGR
ncbi:hypothetical protein AB0J38_21970 [Streptomyces sp. NPDC050095]|uniref:hypothetical protein n=1 Tax=unclassified Streptomyces TaxID=2593676 RepID=UPI00343CAFD3